MRLGQFCAIVKRALLHQLSMNTSLEFKLHNWDFSPNGINTVIRQTNDRSLITCKQNLWCPPAQRVLDHLSTLKSWSGNFPKGMQVHVRIPPSLNGLKMTWRKHAVRKKSYEERHPQEAIKYRSSEPRRKLRRPEQDDTFIDDLYPDGVSGDDL